MYICKYVLCVPVPAGNTSSALILVGPGGMEEQQLYQYDTFFSNKLTLSTEKSIIATCEAQRSLSQKIVTN